MKYLGIAYEEEQKFNELSEAEWQALRQETLSYVETLRKDGRLIATQALQSATTASTVRIRDGRLSVTDGPFAETKDHLDGFYVINAKDLDDALGWASKVSTLVQTAIEVRPFVDEMTS